MTIKAGDKVYGVFGEDSADGGAWLVQVYADPRDADGYRDLLMANRPARMTESVASYHVRELVLL